MSACAIHLAPRRSRLGKWLLVLVPALLLAPGLALAEPNIRASASAVGPGLGDNVRLRWDRNGRFAVFASNVRDLIADQATNGQSNLYLYDRLAGSIRLISHLPSSTTIGANAGAEFGPVPQISDDGNWVAYTSLSTDLVAGQVDGNGARDVFLWSREADQNQLVSRAVGSGTTAANAVSVTPNGATAISGDGRFVLFFSSASNLLSGQQANAFSQAFLYDRNAGNTVLVSHAAGSAVQSPGEKAETVVGLDHRALSADGRWVTFQTVATNLVSGVTDGVGTFDVYLWDRLATLSASLRLVSHAAGVPLTTANGPSSQACLSADGSAVAFVSASTNLEGVNSDSNGLLDVFRYDVAAGTLNLVSHSAGSTTSTGNGSAFFPAISAAGDRVAFESGATNHVSGQVDNNGAFDVFLWQATGDIRLISHLTGANSETGNARSIEPILAEDGNAVAFSSSASNLVAAVSDTNGVTDTFLHFVGGTDVVAVSHTPDATATGNSTSTLADVALGGELVSFASFASNLVSGDTNNGGTDVFFHGSLILADGFESGTLAAWSDHFP